MTTAATSHPTLAGMVVAIAMLAGLAAPAMAQSKPDTENGRYTLAPITDGFVRLDTRSGVVSHCMDKGSGWACYALPDERAAFDEEIGRLQQENEKLKTALAAREPPAMGKTDEALPQEALPKSDRLNPPAPKSAEADHNKIEIPLPSDQDMDRVMSFVERAWRRLVEMASRLQNDSSGKI
ncbi:MAG TPA: hypothetical protein VHC94_02970 [Nitrobacter sp.]|nr:hypothetical protein [Nitrobacter sp.]